MTPALALQIAASSLAVGAFLEARWACRWWRREGARLLAILHFLSAATSLVAAVECLRRMAYHPPARLVVLSDPDLMVLAGIFLLHTITRFMELLRQQERDAITRSLRRDFKARMERMQE